MLYNKSLVGLIKMRGQHKKINFKSILISYTLHMSQCTIDHYSTEIGNYFIILDKKHTIKPFNSCQ
jgi:hypothetical protein